MSRWKSGSFQDLHLHNLPEFPVVPGVYVLYLDGVLSYIGSTENLSGRIWTHIRFATYSNAIITLWGHFTSCEVKYLPTKKLGDWLSIEYRLIRRLKPRFNIRHADVPNRPRKKKIAMSRPRIAKAKA